MGIVEVDATDRGYDSFMRSRCLKCKHYHFGGYFSCEAFPVSRGIPPEIWDGEYDHTKPYPGDNGVRFEPVQKPGR